MGDEMTREASQHAKFCDILQHVLPGNVDLRSICSLLQVSTAVRHTVLSCRAECSLCVRATDGYENAHREKLAAAMCWLPSHAGLVSKLYFSDTAAPGSYALLELALRLCAQHAAQAEMETAPLAAGSRSSAARAVVGTGSVLQNASALPLRLQIFRSAGMPPPTVLRLLQSAGLQYLQVEVVSPHTPVTVSPALASMQELRQLNLGYMDQSDTFCLPMAFAAAIGQLQHLTCLTVRGLTPAGARLLPGSLKQLGLQKPSKDTLGSNDALSGSADENLMSLNHLTALSFLNWRQDDGELCNITLPPQPVNLQTAGKLHLVGPHNLPEVTIFAAEDGCGWEVMLELPAVPHTRSVTLDIPDAQALSAGAFREIGGAIGALSSLTNLSLTVSRCHQDIEHTHLLQQLRKLPSLMGLSLDFDGFYIDYSGFLVSQECCSCQL